MSSSEDHLSEITQLLSCQQERPNVTRRSLNDGDKICPTCKGAGKVRKGKSILLDHQNQIY